MLKFRRAKPSRESGENEQTYNINFLYDYEFTPDSHFYLVVTDNKDGNSAAFIKFSYLFEADMLLRFFHQ